MIMMGYHCQLRVGLRLGRVSAIRVLAFSAGQGEQLEILVELELAIASEGPSRMWATYLLS